MYLNPLDIACYVYCPVLQSKKRTDKITPKLTFLEENIRKAFIEGERNACLKDSLVSPRKLLSAWDKIWWPSISNRKDISMKEAEKLSLKASYLFSDYCKYDLSDWDFPTAGVQVENEIKIGRSIIKTNVDVVKVDLNKDINTVLVNFNRKGLSLRESAMDIAIKTIAYSFYSGRGETITHMSVDVDENKDNVKITTSTFRPESMEAIRKMLYHIERGISSGIRYVNPYMCQECKICQDFIL